MRELIIEVFGEAATFQPQLARHGFDDERPWEVVTWSFDGELRVQCRLVRDGLDAWKWVRESAQLRLIKTKGEWQIVALDREWHHDRRN